MANKRIIELNERTTINMGDFLMVDDATGSRKLAISTLFNYLTYSSLMFVDTLPTTDIDPTVIYLVPHSGSTTQWDEYIYRDNQWILIGTSTLDLSSIYQTKTDNSLQTTSKQVVGAINEIKSALSMKTITPSPVTNSYCTSALKYRRLGNMLIVFGTFTIATTYGGWVNIEDLPVDVVDDGGTAGIMVVTSAQATDKTILLYRINNRHVYVQGNTAGTFYVNAVFEIE